MAANYSTQDIRGFIDQQGIADDPYAIYNNAQKYGVNAAQVDQAMGYDAGTSERWIDQKIAPLRGNSFGQGGADAIRDYANYTGLSTNTPHAAYAVGMEKGWSPEQIDQAAGLAPGTSAQWIEQQGFSGARGPYVGTGRSNWDRRLGAPDVNPFGVSGPQGLGQPSGASRANSSNQGGNPFMQPPQGQAPGGNPVSGQGMPDTGGGYGMAGPNFGGGYGAPPWANANPATNWMAGNMVNQVNDNLQRNVLPGIRGNAMQAGGIGGSRQGVAEGLAIGDSMTGLGNALGSLYGGQFNQDRNYGLQSDSLDLNVYNANQNWMRQGQQDQLGLIDRMLGWNQQGLGAATQAQNSPLNYWQQFTNGATQIGGMGGANSQQLQGNPWLGALGGAMTGMQLYNNWGR